jgi:translation initiation factor IF-3
MAHVDLGRNIFTKIKAELLPVSKVERDAKMEGRRMTMVLQPDHKTAVKAAPGGKPSGSVAKPSGTGEKLNIPARPAPAPVAQPTAAG